jgi:hypothetical protein
MPPLFPRATPLWGAADADVSPISVWGSDAAPPYQSIATPKTAEARAKKF